MATQVTSMWTTFVRISRCLFLEIYAKGQIEMNLSHIITEFSFGPHFPEIVQPLDDSFEVTDKRMLAHYYSSKFH